MTPEEKIVREIEARLHRLKALNDIAAAKWPHEDLRLALIGWPGNVLHSYLLTFAMANDTITEKAWWHQRYGKPEPLPADIQAMRNLEAMQKHAAFVFFMSRIEWCFRQLVTFLYPGACGHGSAAFKNLYDYLFAQLHLSHYTALYDICRHVRNSVHSNGVFVDPIGANDHVSWAGVDYDFVHMHPIEFMDYDRMFPLYDGLIDSIEELLKAPPVESPAFIERKIH